MEQQFTEKEVLAFLMDNGKIKSDDVIEEMNKIQLWECYFDYVSFFLGLVSSNKQQAHHYR